MIVAFCGVTQPTVLGLLYLVFTCLWSVCWLVDLVIVCMG